MKGVITIGFIVIAVSTLVITVYSAYRIFKTKKQDPDSLLLWMNVCVGLTSFMFSSIGACVMFMIWTQSK